MPRAYLPAYGFNWCKQREKRKRSRSVTAGKTKGNNCVCKPIEKYLAKSSRSYKHTAYPVWDSKTKIKNRYR